MTSDRRVVWVSTATQTQGGVATYVKTVMDTPLWQKWSIHHVSTHRDGSRTVRLVAFLRGAAEISRLLVARPPSLVHIHTASYGSFWRKSLLTWLTRSRGVPVVLHVHGAAFAEFYEESPRIIQAYIRATLRTANAVIALGPTWAERLGRIAPGLCAVVIPNAVRPSRDVAHRSSDETFSALFLGRVTEDKGVFALVEAWAVLHAELPAHRLRLVIAGSGEEEQVRALAHSLGVASTVEVVGWQDALEVDQLLNKTDLLVLPSWWEGQPMAVLEAMGRGVPIVASRVGGVPDLVGPDAGILVPPRDVPALARALGQMATDPLRRDQMGRRAWQRVRSTYDVDVTWRMIDNVYEELTGGS